MSKKAERQKRMEENHLAQKRLKVKELVSWEEEADTIAYGMVRSFYGKEHVIVYSIPDKNKPRVCLHLQQVECAEISKVVQEDGERI